MSFNKIVVVITFDLILSAPFVLPLWLFLAKSLPLLPMAYFFREV